MIMGRTGTEDFWTVVAAARSLGEDRAGTLQAVYERGWTGHTERAGETAHDAIGRAGRIGANFSDDPTWLAMDELCGISGGAADAALAVLARDLIDPADFAVLTRPWRDVGLDIPGEMVDVAHSAPIRLGVFALPRWEVTVRLLATVACLAGIAVCFDHLPAGAVHVVGLIAVLVLAGLAVAGPLICSHEQD